MREKDRENDKRLKRPGAVFRLGEGQRVGRLQWVTMKICRCVPAAVLHEFRCYNLEFIEL